MGVKEQIAANNVIWGEMMKAGNAKGLADLYTDNCEVMAPGAPLVEGKENFQKLVEGFIAGGCRGAKLTTACIQPGADDLPQNCTFWERGNFIFYTEGEKIMDTGKYMVIWKKVEDGKLMIFMDIWNSNGK